MNDLHHVGLFFSIFAAALILYGLALVKTGDKSLLPYRAAHSVRTSADVKRVGRIVVWVGLCIGVPALLGVFATAD